jgi:hypothetical protein
LLGGQRVVLRATKRAVAPFGGVAVFVSYLRKIDLLGTARQHMPVRWRSPNRIDPTTTWTAFLISVLVGAERFAHANWLRGDEALRQLLGLDRFPTDDTIRNLFKQFSMGHVQRFFAPLAEFQRAAGLSGYREPATLCTQVLTCGAMLGRAGRHLVLHMG